MREMDFYLKYFGVGIYLSLWQKHVSIVLRHILVPRGVAWGGQQSAVRKRVC